MSTPAPEPLRFPHPSPPTHGTPMPVAPGVAWLRLPLPYSLDHINVWLLEDGDGTTLVDTGIGLDPTRGYWEPVLVHLASTRPLRRIIVTHHHPDHIGLATWLQARTGAAIWMTRAEYAMARHFLAGDGRARITESLEFYRRYGWADAETAGWFERADEFQTIIAGLPGAVHYIEHGDQVQIGAQTWQAIVTPGHAPGHLVLHSPALALMITGDQLLPTITSNVGLRPFDADADPLGQYLESVRALGALDVGQVNLPSHGLPYLGIAARARALARHHAAKFAQIHGLCAEPRAAADLTRALFPRAMDRLNTMLALTETLAHLRYMERRGELIAEIGHDAIVRFRTCDEGRAAI